jgi:hypothetical protein
LHDVERPVFSCPKKGRPSENQVSRFETQKGKFDDRAGGKYIQFQLGHSSLSVALDVYAHLMKPTSQEAAERFENLNFQKDGSNMVAN